jgi:AcrR family transcriptional regulator
MAEDRPTTKIGRPAVVPGETPTRDKILLSAIDLFAKNGYDGTSVRQIAKAVGVTESAIYRHYPGKEAILDAIFAYAESRIYTPLPAEQNRDGPIGVSVFRGLLAPLPEIIGSNPYVVKIVRIMYGEMHHNDKIRLYFQKEYVERADDYLEALFKECIENGSIKPCDPRALAQIFNAFRSEWAFKYYIIDRGESLNVEELRKDLEGPIEFFEQLLLPGKDSR